MFIPKSNFSLKPCQLKGHLWYDAIMWNRKVLVTILSFLYYFNHSGLFLTLEKDLWDLFSSTELLKEAQLL